jgi:hypothetical protein
LFAFTVLWLRARMGIKYDWDWQSLWWIPESELYYRNDMVGVGDDAMRAR